MVTIPKPEIGIDLSRLSQEDLKKIIEVGGLPQSIRKSAATLYFLGENTHYRQNNDERAGDWSDSWTKPTSPRTLMRIKNLLNK